MNQPLFVRGRLRHAKDYSADTSAPTLMIGEKAADLTLA